jgi:hypothetical protein
VSIGGLQVNLVRGIRAGASRPELLVLVAADTACAGPAAATDNPVGGHSPCRFQVLPDMGFAVMEERVPRPANPEETAGYGRLQPEEPAIGARIDLLC